jgi:hypothetical protein
VPGWEVSCYPTTWYAAAAAGVSAMPSIPGCSRSAVNFHTLSSTCGQVDVGRVLINANGTFHRTKKHPDTPPVAHTGP